MKRTNVTCRNVVNFPARVGCINVVPLKKITNIEPVIMSISRIKTKRENQIGMKNWEGE